MKIEKSDAAQGTTKTNKDARVNCFANLQTNGKRHISIAASTNWSLKNSCTKFSNRSVHRIDFSYVTYLVTGYKPVTKRDEFPMKINDVLHRRRPAAFSPDDSWMFDACFTATGCCLRQVKTARFLSAMMLLQIRASCMTTEL